MKATPKIVACKATRKQAGYCMITKKNIEYYLNLPWTYTIEQDEEKGRRFYIIRVNELPGICTDAKTIEEGMDNIKEAIEAAVRLYLKNGEEVPEPKAFSN